MNMNRYMMMLAAGAAASAGGFALHAQSGDEVSTEGQEARRPNVVFILADDLGYGDITPYGQQRILTPNLERLASQGMLFTQAYAGCTVSAPSRCALMTGMHTGHTFVRGNYEVDPEGQVPMPEGTFTLGTLFHEAGYATGAFGKWGLGYPGSESDPLKVGFDEFFGYNCQRRAHSYYPDHLWYNDERVEYPENVDPGRVTYSQDIIHEKGLEFIRENADRPFFAYLAYTLPHAELCLPHDEVYDYYVDLFKDDPEDAKSFRGNGDYGYSEHPMASFAAMVTRLDRYVGDVLALLEEKGVADNTLVIFTSDNGPHREGGANPDFFDGYGPLRGIKRDMYEGGIRVPFIARWPGRIEEGVTTDRAVAFWDMLPTFADLLGEPEVSQREHSDGVSALPVLTGEGAVPEHPYFYWEFHESGGRQAVRLGDWKGVRLNVGNDQTSFELYNLAEDLHEDHNVADEHPDITRVIQDIMDDARTPSVLFNFGR
ncbi:MAG: arylsulfatase [Bacteroidales bacterium]|nr:arylsulfatase [Bacteroidales bacterium]